MMKNSEKRNEKLYIITIIGSILILVGMMLYNHFSHYFSISSKMQNMGMGMITETKQIIENYLTKNLHAVQTTAITLEYMIENQMSPETIEDFLIYESDKYTREIDENFTGIYGFLNGEYIHGAGWIPDEDYNPTERDWYRSAKEASGEVTLVSPYIDEITGNLILSISKMFPDQNSVISIDITLNEIQHIIATNPMNDLGNTFLVDKSGLIISHCDQRENGKNYLSDGQMSSIIQTVFSAPTSYFSRELYGNDCQILSKQITDDWYLVMVLDKKLFFHDVHKSLTNNILLFSVLSSLIIFFYIYTFKMLKKSMETERNSNKKIEQTNSNLIRALVRTIDAKDRYTNGHSIRVADYAVRIAKQLGKSKEEQQIIYYSGLLHDVGKIRVPEDIINKPGKLTPEEFEHIKLHPVTGYQIIKDIYDDKMLALGVKYHHERYDGKGYPNGLSGENIPEIARIIGVADTYDAMASNRSYRKALPQEKVREEIVNGKGTQFDPQIADIMLQMIDEDTEYKLKEDDSLQKTILFVDDDLMNIRILEFIMKDDPLYKIVSVTSGREALELIDKLKIDLIILDVEMPDMDGFETLKEIRKKYDTPVAFMTGNKDIETIQKAAELGVEDYIGKPIVPLSLKETIHNLFNE